jgi:hypothetical protein
VYNGGGPQGSAQQTLTWLQNSQGMRLATNKGNAPAEVMRTTLRYAPNQAAMARTLAGVMGLPATALKQETGNAEGQQAMTLTLGPDYTGAGVPITGAAKAPEGVQKAEADQQICAK